MAETNIQLSNDLEIVLRHTADGDSLLIEVWDGMNLLGDTVVDVENLRTKLVATVLAIE